MKQSIYWLSPESRQALALRSLEIRADLARRREQRARYREAFDFIAYARRVEVPFVIGGTAL